MSKASVFYYVKRISFIRLIFYPFVLISRRVQTKHYIESEESRRISELKGIHEGERCFVIGNGPGLCVGDLNTLKDEITFASNRVYRIFDRTDWRPDYYVAFEPEFVKDNIKEISHIPVNRARFIRNNRYYGIDEKNYCINCLSRFCIKKESKRSVVFSDDISKYIGDGYTVVFTIFQIAFYMGFKKIYLLGMDHNKGESKTNHFYCDFETDNRMPTFWEGIEYAYCLVNEYARNHGIDIINISRESNLEVFPKSSIDEVVGREH